jgi:DNA helicase-2/ATP-dependent DNA helicase PcrA
MRILRRDIGKLSGEHFTERFTVYDSDDSTRLIKTCLSELDIDEKRFPSSMVRSSISRAKDRLIGDGEYEAAALEDNPSDRYMAKMIGRIYRRYQAKLRAADALDFDDIIMLTVRLLSENAELREYYSRRFPYMCVDEFQDTNAAQYRLAELICGEHKNLCVVGDDDQSIYKFRGATVENIMLFAERFDPKTIVIKLEQNYRSTGMILAAANSVIGNNSHTFKKALWTENPTGERIVICKAPDGYAEGRFAADTVKSLVAQSQNGKTYSDFAVLYRINAQSNAFEKAFSAAGIPYRIIGGLRFYDRKEIKDILAYLHVLQNPRDMLHFRRIVNDP